MKPLLEPPLCVDLDGTLVRTDMTQEHLLRLVLRRPFSLWRLPGWLLRGRAHLKRELGRRTSVDAATLPFNEKLVAHLLKEAGSGREMLLVTASDAAMALPVADLVGLFDEVMASDGSVNLKSRAKRDALVARFGEGGFDYAGNESADLKVWAASRKAIAVNTPDRVLRRAASKLTLVLEDRQPRLPALAHALSLRSWAPSLIALVPPLSLAAFGERVSAVSLAAVVVALCASSSVARLATDFLRLDDDRRDERLRERPLASGNVSIASSARWLVLMAVVLAAALAPLGWQARGVTVAFAALSLMSAHRRRVTPEAALITQAALVMLRAIAGVAAVLP